MHYVICDIAHIHTHNDNYAHAHVHINILLFILTNGLEGTCAHECIHPA